MSETLQPRVLSSVDKDGFVGRQLEASSLLSHVEAKPGRGLLLLSAPGTGSSELLRQVFDDLFAKRSGIVPVYFEFLESDRSPGQAASRFLYEFLKQFTAYRTREPRIIGSSPESSELVSLVPAPDREFVRNLAGSGVLNEPAGTNSSLAARAFAAPLRAAVEGITCALFLDGLENTIFLEDGEAFLSQLGRTFSHSGLPFVFAGKRRFLEKKLRDPRSGLSGARAMELGALDPESAGRLADGLSAQFGVAVSTQSRDLVVDQLGARPAYLLEMFEKASAASRDLRGFRDVEQTYAEMLFRGRLKGEFDSRIELIAGRENRKDLISFLRASADEKRPRVTRGDIAAVLEGGRFGEEIAVAALEAWELAVAEAGFILPVGGDLVLSDLIEASWRLEAAGEPFPKVFAETLSMLLKRAPEQMSVFYRKASSLGLADLMSGFNCQEVPLGLIDYGIFKQFHKGKSPEKILAELDEDLERIKLPQIFHSEPVSSFYPQVRELLEDERTALALGFEHADYLDENEVVWLAAEIDSKLETDAETADFWCDRLEMAALANEFDRFRLWLVSPEGFTADAREVLHNRGAIGSSRIQVELLSRYLSDGDDGSKPVSGESFEIVIPMGEDTEMIAAYAVEEMARKHSFSSRDINQIKTALIEACINAAEHSLSPDRKIKLNVTFSADEIEIVVENRGLRFAGRPAPGRLSGERRGWGLNLMRSLMDDVRFEHVDDGTRLTLTKIRSAE